MRLVISLAGLMLGPESHFFYLYVDRLYNVDCASRLCRSSAGGAETPFAEPPPIICKDNYIS